MVNISYMTIYRPVSYGAYTGKYTNSIDCMMDAIERQFPQDLRGDIAPIPFLIRQELTPESLGKIVGFIRPYAVGGVATCHLDDLHHLIAKDQEAIPGSRIHHMGFGPILYLDRPTDPQFEAILYYALIHGARKFLNLDPETFERVIRPALQGRHEATPQDVSDGNQPRQSETALETCWVR